MHEHVEYLKRWSNLCAFQLWLSICEDRPSPCGCDRYPWSHFPQDHGSQEVRNATYSDPKKAEMEELSLSQHLTCFHLKVTLIQTPRPVKDASMYVSVSYKYNFHFLQRERERETHTCMVTYRSQINRTKQEVCIRTSILPSLNH